MCIELLVKKHWTILIVKIMLQKIYNESFEGLEAEKRYRKKSNFANGMGLLYF